MGVSIQKRKLDDAGAKALLKSGNLNDTDIQRIMEFYNKPPPKKVKQKGPGIRLAIGGHIENPMEKKQKPLYEEELGMYGGGAVRKKLYARGGSPRPTRG